MLKFAVDWLALTVKGETHETAMHETIVDYASLEIRPCRPYPGYTDAIENRAGATVSWNVKRGDMGVHVEYSGSTLALYRTEGTDPSDMARWHVSKGHTITRLDVAIDVIDSDMKPSDLYSQLEKGKAHTVSGRTYKMWKGSDGGETLYIGSRTSNIFLRIYDKGAEMHTDDNWIRIELELKGPKARLFANLIANDGTDTAIERMRGVLLTVVHFPGKLWAGIVGDEPIKLTDTSKKKSDTKAWLLELVAPAMGKYIAKTGDLTITEDFWNTVELWRKMSDNWAEIADEATRDEGVSSLD